MSDTPSCVWAGVDLGGTGTRITLVNEVNDDIAGTTVPTSSFAAHAVDQLADLIKDLVPCGAELSGVGIGASGPVDLKTGRIHNRATLPQFTEIDVAGALQRRLLTPVWIDNDAVVAGLAESNWGAATRTESVLCVTLGTGIGAAMILHGSPVRAADGQHPEGGHIPVAGKGNPCYCGLPQCWEQVASRTALDRLQSAKTYSTPELWTEYAGRVASGLIALLTLYHPACVVISGSVARKWTELQSPLRLALSPFREFDPSLPMFGSTLGDRGGALGAALLPQHALGWHSEELSP